MTVASDTVSLSLPAEDEFPAGGSFRERCRFLLRYAILAPSTRNTQPWKFALHENGVDVYADYCRRLPTADPGSRELLMSMGAAIMNLRVAAAHFRFSCEVEYNHSGDSERPLAQVFLAAGSPGNGDLAPFFPQLTRRRTCRHPFLVSRVPATVQQHFLESAQGFHSALEIVTDGGINRGVADLVAEAEERLLENAEYRREVDAWTPGGEHGAEEQRAAVRDAAGQMAPATLLELRRRAVARDKNLCLDAPALLVLAGEDSISGWLDTGEMLEKLLLTITREDLQVSFFNMPVLVPDLRLKLRVILALSAMPQLLLRVGYCLEETPRTPRRRIEEVTIHQR